MSALDAARLDAREAEFQRRRNEAARIAALAVVDDAETRAAARADDPDQQIRLIAESLRLRGMDSWHRRAVIREIEQRRGILAAAQVAAAISPGAQ